MVHARTLLVPRLRPHRPSARRCTATSRVAPQPQPQPQGSCRVAKLPPSRSGCLHIALTGQLPAGVVWKVPKGFLNKYNRSNQEVGAARWGSSLHPAPAAEALPYAGVQPKTAPQQLMLAVQGAVVSPTP